MSELPKPLVRCDQGFLLAPFSVDYEARNTWIILFCVVEDLGAMRTVSKTFSSRSAT